MATIKSSPDVQTPVSSRIAESLSRRIRTGDLAVGERLPAERELARQLGVCAATVQKALKQVERDGLVESQRGRGRFVANWRQSKTWAVAVILYDAANLGHPVMMQRLSGVQPLLEKAGYHIHFIAMNRQAGGGEQGWLKLIEPSRYDGAIVVAHQAQLRQVYSLSEHLPLVWMDQHCVAPGLLGVRSDMVGGGLLAGEHLVELGHREIALLNAGQAVAASQDQHEGVQLAARRKAGVTVRWLNVPRSSDHERIHQVIRDAFTGPDRPTALICGADDLVPAALEQLTALGLNVPADVSLVGWNDTLAPPTVPLALTSVQIDFSAIGRTAAETLQRMLKGDPPDPAWLEGQVKPATLVQRDSTAPPSSGRSHRGTVI